MPTYYIVWNNEIVDEAPNKADACRIAGKCALMQAFGSPVSVTLKPTPQQLAEWLKSLWEN